VCVYLSYLFLFHCFYSLLSDSSVYVLSTVVHEGSDRVYHLTGLAEIEITY